jgi:hypothetical protein
MPSIKANLTSREKRRKFPAADASAALPGTRLPPCMAGFCGHYGSCLTPEFSNWPVAIPAF